MNIFIFIYLTVVLSECPIKSNSSPAKNTSPSFNSGIKNNNRPIDTLSPSKSETDSPTDPSATSNTASNTEKSVSTPKNTENTSDKTANGTPEAMKSSQNCKRTSRIISSVKPNKPTLKDTVYQSLDDSTSSSKRPYRVVNRRMLPPAKSGPRYRIIIKNPKGDVVQSDSTTVSEDPYVYYPTCCAGDKESSENTCPLNCTKDSSENTCPLNCGKDCCVKKCTTNCAKNFCKNRCPANCPKNCCRKKCCGKNCKGPCCKSGNTSD